MTTLQITILEKEDGDGDAAISELGIPDAILTSSATLTPDEVERLQKRWIATFGYGGCGQESKRLHDLLDVIGSIGV